MYRVAVVEDERIHRDRAVKSLQRYGEQNDCIFEISTFDNGGAFLMSNPYGYDVILMDIDMPVVNGMDAAREIRKKDSQVVIVFITNMANYAVQGYEVEALDFIVKPLNYDVFAFKMKRILSRVQNRRTAKTFLVNAKEGVHKIAVEDLIYVEVDHHTLTYHTKGKAISVRGSLKDTEDQLAGNGFFKCNQCYLINLRYVTQVVENEVILGSIPLQISRGNKKKLLSAMAQYMLNA